MDYVSKDQIQSNREGMEPISNIVKDLYRMNWVTKTGLALIVASPLVGIGVGMSHNVYPLQKPATPSEVMQFGTLEKRLFQIYYGFEIAQNPQIAVDQKKYSDE